MGEPLDNYNQVLMSIKAMTDTSRFGLSPSRISISTVGVIPRIKDLIKDAPKVGLALSLHAPTQELRQQIVPTSKAWKIEKIIEVCDEFITMQNSNNSKSSRHVLVEYVMIDGINDSEKVAHELGNLLKGKSVLLNLIPYNHTDVPYNYNPPTQKTQNDFVDIIRNVYNVKTLLRQTMGSDISSACGQLVIDQDKKGCSSEDIEDLLRVDSKRNSPIQRKPRLNLESKKTTKKEAVKEDIFPKFPLAIKIILLV